MSTLVYVGANVGSSLWSMFDKFDDVYVFEPDPEMFSQLKKRYKQFEWVTLVNAACANETGKAKFYVTPNRVSSSMSTVSTTTLLLSLSLTHPGRSLPALPRAKLLHPSSKEAHFPAAH